MSVKVWHRSRRVVDWRFLVCLIALLLVATICFGFFKRVQQADALIDTAKTNSIELVKLRQKLDRVQDAADARGRAATRQRLRLERQLAVLTQLLLANGIEVPDSIKDSLPPPPKRLTPGVRRTPAAKPRIQRPATQPKPKPAPVKPRPAPQPAPRPTPAPGPLSGLSGLVESLLKPGQLPKELRSGLKPGQTTKHQKGKKK